MNPDGIRQHTNPIDEQPLHPAIRIAEDLIRLQSVNPHYGKGAKGEAEVADYVEARMKKAGLKVSRQRVFDGRDNVIVELRVGKPEAALLFEAHMDTVSLGSMPNPTVPIIADGRLYGRGSCDTKGSLAGMLYAMETGAARADELSADLVLCASVDEEHAYRGILRFLDHPMPIAGAIVGEPTGLAVVGAHKGCARFAVRTHGRAAHSSVPGEGVNAVYEMMHVIRHIRERVEPELMRRSHPLCGSPTVSVGTIEGGSQINIVPESCVIQVDRRLIPGERPDEVLERFKESLGREMDPLGVRFTVEELLLDWALDTPLDSEVVRSARAVARSLGLSGDVVGVPYGTDASKLQQLKGIPSIVFGPGSIAQAHTNEEFVPVREVGLAAEFYWRMARAMNKPVGGGGS